MKNQGYCCNVSEKDITQLGNLLFLDSVYIVTIVIATATQQFDVCVCAGMWGRERERITSKMKEMTHKIKRVVLHC